MMKCLEQGVQSMVLYKVRFSGTVMLAASQPCSLASRLIIDRACLIPPWTFFCTPCKVGMIIAPNSCLRNQILNSWYLTHT